MGDKSLPYDVLKTSFHKLRFCNNPVCGRFELEPGVPRAAPYATLGHNTKLILRNSVGVSRPSTCANDSAIGRRALAIDSIV